METMKVRLTFTEPILGTSSSNPEIHSEFIASKAPDAPTRNEEITRLIQRDGVDEAIDRAMTIFPMDDDGIPFMWDYQIKGFFKDACSMLKRCTGTKSASLKAYKKEIDGLVFIEEREIPFDVNGEIGTCERPLRAQTAQGERISLANSESIPAGSTLEFTITSLKDGLMPTVEEWLDYGRLRGLGQWRNSGKGRFVWERLD